MWRQNGTVHIIIIIQLHETIRSTLFMVRPPQCSIGVFCSSKLYIRNWIIYADPRRQDWQAEPKSLSDVNLRWDENQ